MEGLKVVKNQELKGVELYFEEIPTKEVRENLKSNGFRWHNIKKCWYAKESNKILETVEKLGNGEILEAKKETLKFLQIIDNFEEFENICNSENWHTWGNAEKTQKYRKDIFNRDIIIKTQDDYYITLDKKPKIDSCMYYNDEYEAPNKDFETFKNYNINLHYNYKNIEAYKEEKERLKEMGSASGAYDYTSIFLESFNNNHFVNYGILSDKRGEFIRYLSKEEEEEFYKIIEMLKAKYIERLEKYFKRYSDNITTWGYWANR